MAYRKVGRFAAIVAACISCILIVLHWESISSTASILSITNVNIQSPKLRSSECVGDCLQNTKTDHMPGSNAYYASADARAALVTSFREKNNELQSVLKKTAIKATITTRAIIVYLPPNMPKFEKELKGMLLSIAWMRTFQPVDVKTDFIVFTPPGSAKFPVSIGCVEDKIPRSGSSDPERCIVMEHIPLKSRSGPSPILEAYSNYVDSMLILSEFKFGNAYDVLLRSDMDVFITPAFGTWKQPEGVAIVTGKGGYTSDNVKKHLKWVTEQKFGLKDNGIENIGSTWVGRCEVLVAAGRATIAAMEWLHTQEFTEYEITASGIDGWPYWHWPVLLLYGGHIAVNQIPKSQVFVTTFESSVALDFPSTSLVPLPTSVLHVHCWHTDDVFSKFEFQAGKYKDVDLATHKEMKSAADLAMTIAVSSDRLTPAEFSAAINSPQQMKDKGWIRDTQT